MFRRSRLRPFLTRAVIGAAGAAAGPSDLMAHDATIRVSSSTNTAPAAVMVHVGATAVPVTIPPHTPASVKRDMIRDALASQGFAVTDDGPAGRSLTIHGAAGAVSLATGGTGEASDAVVTAAPASASVSFAGSFAPLGHSLQPAVFTAGIITDVGEVTMQVSAQELNFQTDGPIICQALFQRLAPRAPQYGAQINYAGDRLEIYFDPAYTLTQGGVIFGTTSPTEGCSAQVVPPPPPPPRPGIVVRVDASTAPVIETELIQLSLVSLNPIPIPPLAPAGAVRNAVLAGLVNAGVNAAAEPDDRSLRILDAGPAAVVAVSPGRTGQARTDLAAAGARFARVTAPGLFDPFDYAGQPAVFSAGIITDVGVLTMQVSAQELNFQTDGPIICQALFQRLAPRAPQYGAQINYAGDRLEIYFDPAYTLTQGGVVFGTTSTGPGMTGALHMTVPCRVDRNGDGRITPADVAAFVSEWLASLAQGTLAGDFNGDGAVTPADVGAFVSAWYDALLNGC
jgi:hypothetical protein